MHTDFIGESIVESTSRKEYVDTRKDREVSFVLSHSSDKISDVW